VKEQPNFSMNAALNAAHENRAAALRELEEWKRKREPIATQLRDAQSLAALAAMYTASGCRAPTVDTSKLEEEVASLDRRVADAEDRLRRAEGSLTAARFSTLDVLVAATLGLTDLTELTLDQRAVRSEPNGRIVLWSGKQITPSASVEAITALAAQLRAGNEGLAERGRKASELKALLKRRAEEGRRLEEWRASPSERGADQMRAKLERIVADLDQRIAELDQPEPIPPAAEPDLRTSIVVPMVRTSEVRAP
jgi:hypothetical protein